MRKYYGWIAVALASFVGSTALAQQTYPDIDEPMQDEPMQDEPMPSDQPGAPTPQSTEEQAPPPAAKEPGTSTTAGDAGKADASKPQTSSRLSQIESDGVRLKQLDQLQITELQRALQEAGYYTAEIDGIVGPQTKRALRMFYSDQAQLAARGMILPQGAAALGLDEAEVERVRGVDQEAQEPPAGTPGTDDTKMDDTTDTKQPPEPSGPTPSPGAPNPVPQTGPHGGPGTSGPMPGTTGPRP